VVLALAPLVLEPGLLEEAAGAVVKERRRDPLSLGVLRIGLYKPATLLGDQLQGAA
jgi:hypothetical protein